MQTVKKRIRGGRIGLQATIMSDAFEKFWTKPEIRMRRLLYPFANYSRLINFVMGGIELNGCLLYTSDAADE